MTDPPARDWAPHTTEQRPWRQSAARGPRADRQVTHIDVSLPPLIAELDYVPDQPLGDMMDSAAAGLGQLDQTHGRRLKALNQLLLRTESVASSKIENVEASLADYGRALLGTGAGASAVSMAAATEALVGIIARTEESGHLSQAALLEAHLALFRRHPDERMRAGRTREVQNWIGGSDYSPRNALFVPPPPETVGRYLDDLFAFTERDDLPPLAQAAIAHAQFESIHPFIDGNGRIGRTLLHAVLRRRRVTRHLTVPIASGLVGHRERYFDALADYREGRAYTIIAMLTSATTIATHESRRTATNLHLIRRDWEQALGEVRPGTTLHRVLTALPSDPIVTVDLIAERVGTPPDDAEETLARLQEAGILEPVNRRRRERIWGARDILDELNDLNTRIDALARRRSDPTAP